MSTGRAAWAFPQPCTVTASPLLSAGLGLPPRWAHAVLHIQRSHMETAQSTINVSFLCVSGQIFLRESSRGWCVLPGGCSARLSTCKHHRATGALSALLTALFISLT